MARLDALPSKDIIHGFRGIIDFYLWRGLPVARSWPKMGKPQMTQATIDAGETFGAISSAYADQAGQILEALTEDAGDQNRTARDIYMSAAHGYLHEVAD